MEGAAEAVFSLSRMLTLRGFNRPTLLIRGVELSTADMRAAFALRLTTDGLMLLRSVKAEVFFGVTPDLLALGPVAQRNTSETTSQQPYNCSLLLLAQLEGRGL